MIQSRAIFLHSANKNINVKVLSTDELKSLQNHLWKMYKDLEEVCDRHNLQISLAYGNVIGVMRHGGWIPWDDDLDVHMPRKDYELFLKKYAKELPSQYKVYSAFSEEGPIYRFAKIIDTSTTFVPIGGEKSESSGVFIYIFPIDNIGANPITNKLKKYWQYFLMYTATSVSQWESHSEEYKKIMYCTQEGKRNYIFRNIWGKIFSFLPSKRWYSYCETFWCFKKDKGYAHVKSALETCGKKIPSSLFFPFKKHDCKMGTVFLPNKVEDYLKLHYSNWMEIPKDKDKWHHYVKEFNLSSKE